MRMTKFWPDTPIGTDVSSLSALAPIDFTDRSSVIYCRPEPFKFIHFPTVEEVGLYINVDDDSVKLSTKKPIKGIVLDVDGDDVKWSDQAIDLVPGDPQVVRAVGLNGRAVKARYLGDGTA